MHLVLATVGKLKSGPERQLYDKYHERTVRAGKSQGFNSLELVEISESRGASVEERQKQETRALLDRLASDVFIILWDEKGTNLSSRQFSEKLVALRDDGISDVCFIIGGPDGTSSELKRKASLVLSFGRMTLPHGIARIVLVEQLYRAVLIAGGHPYHRD